MEWISEKPKQGESGFYWFHMWDIDEMHWEEPFIVYVTFDGIIETAYVQRYGLSDKIPFQKFGNIDPEEPNWIGHWYSPLKMPEVS